MVTARSDSYAAASGGGVFAGIGPSLPTWVPSPGNVAVLTVANGGLANSFRDVVAPYYDAFWFVKVANSYGGGAKNPYWGPYGCCIHFSGGHSNTNDNSVVISEYGATQVTFRRLTDPVPWFGQATDSTTKGNNSAANINALLDWVGDPNTTGVLQYGEATGLTGADAAWNGQPGASHTYGIPVVVGPADGGATYGTLYKTQNPAVGYINFKGTIAAHRLEFTSTTAESSTRAWVRDTNERFDEALSWSSPTFCCYVPTHNRIYHVARGNSASVLWYDIATHDWVSGTGTPFGLNGSDVIGGDAESGCLFYVPSRSLLICCYSASNVVVVQWMDVSASDPTLGGTATLSQSLSTLTLTTDPDPSRANWGAATWCPDNSRIIVAGVERDVDAAFEVEIPATLTDTWAVTRAPYGAGQTFYPNHHTTHQKFQYDIGLKAIYYFWRAYPVSDGIPDTAYVYRPRNT